MILFFVRLPTVGVVKTRLAASVGVDEACRIHRLLAERCFANAMAVPDAKIIVCGTGGSVEEFERWLPEAADRWEQPNGDLGARLEELFLRAFDAGATKVVAIGSDAPLLDANSMKCAIGALDDNEVTILPATDGGYVLIGANRFCPELFRDMPWSSEQLLLRTMEVCARAGLRPFLGAGHQDVDTEADWNRVRAQLRDPTLPTENGDIS